jgi:hypothetical protein
VREASRLAQPMQTRKANDKAIGRAGAQGVVELAVKGH